MIKRALPVIAVVLLVVGAAAAWLVLRPAQGPAQAAAYHCPMHPTVVSDRPGACPICHMSLVPIDRGGRDDDAHAGTTGRSPVPDRATVRIGAEKRQLIGVRTERVERAPFRRAIRAVGRVTFDEMRLHHVHAKVGGYVERLYTGVTGEHVDNGEPLLEIYSPELLASQQEYLVALEARQRTSGSSVASVAAAGAQLVASARRRLELFDVSEDQIRMLEATGEARRTVTLEAPMSGTIIQRNVTHGMKVDSEMTLLDIADLSHVWVLASIYEYELPFVHEGQRATMVLSYLPGRSFEGRVSLVYPTLDPATRTVQVRLEFPNPDQLLKPEMYAEVVLEADMGQRLAVSDTAVLDTGTRSLVFVDRGEGLFEPREVQIGMRLPERHEVLSGLAEGESVLTAANFYVDSESRLKAALEALAPAP
jgi:Cu(I)/Ag(I) efflux system membrane fusion protein